MEEKSSEQVDKPLSWKEAQTYGNGNLFKNHAIKGSVESWRHKRNTGGSPNARIAMCEITPFVKDPADILPPTPDVPIIYCKCEFPQVSVRTSICECCGMVYDFYGEGKA